jgi:hypothetical protein
MPYLLAAASCESDGEGACPGENLVVVALIVFLVFAFALGIMAWVWFRWERGPFWAVMRILTCTREKRGPRR